MYLYCQNQPIILAINNRDCAIVDFCQIDSSQNCTIQPSRSRLSGDRKQSWPNPSELLMARWFHWFCTNLFGSWFSIFQLIANVNSMLDSQHLNDITIDWAFVTLLSEFLHQSKLRIWLSVWIKRSLITPFLNIHNRLEIAQSILDRWWWHHGRDAWQAKLFEVVIWFQMLPRGVSMCILWYMVHCSFFCFLHIQSTGPDDQKPELIKATLAKTLNDLRVPKLCVF
jgi:hypothetical protein